MPPTTTTAVMMMMRRTIRRRRRRRRKNKRKKLGAKGSQSVLKKSLRDQNSVEICSVFSWCQSEEPRTNRKYR